MYHPLPQEHGALVPAPPPHSNGHIPYMLPPAPVIQDYNNQVRLQYRVLYVFRNL